MVEHLNKVLSEHGSAELDMKENFMTIVKFMARLGFRNYTAVGLREIMRLAIEYREKHNIARKDMLQLMMQLRNTGKINEDDDNWSAKPNADSGKQKEFTWDHIGAQGYIFYIAGQETISSAAALARAQQEVDEVLARYDGQLSYDALREMPFLELCLQETIRKYPLPFLNRECTKDYTIPGTSHVIEKGIPVIIPLLGMHRDAQYFPNPMTYDPDRFAPSSPNFNNNAYMPYGIGPRQCVALRMGMISSKLGVVKILQNFNIEIMRRREIIMDNHSVGIQPKSGLKVRLSRKPTFA